MVTPWFRPVTNAMKYAAFTKNAPHKPRNGESFLIKKHVSGTVILVMASGSEADPCDWKASETATQTIAKCIDHEAHISKSAITGWIKQAAKEVQNIHGICAGAKTGLALAVIQENGNGWLANIGTATILTWQNDQLEEIKTGQTFELLGEKIGSANIVTLQLQPNHGLVMMSEGVEKNPLRNFVKDFSYLFSRPDPDQNLPLLMEKYLTGQERDLTALVLKF